MKSPSPDFAFLSKTLFSSFDLCSHLTWIQIDSIIFVCYLVLFEYDSIFEKDIIQIRINHYKNNKKKESYSI